MGFSRWDFEKCAPADDPMKITEQGQFSLDSFSNDNGDTEWIEETQKQKECGAWTHRSGSLMGPNGDMITKVDECWLCGAKRGMKHDR